MGCSTVGFVALPDGYRPDVFEVRDRITKALEEACLLPGFKVWVDNADLSHRSFYLNFFVSPENIQPWTIRQNPYTIHRNLSVHFDCHNDYSEIYEGRKLTFSLGDSDVSHDAIRSILEQFRDIGDCYFIPNDCCNGHEVLARSEAK